MAESTTTRRGTEAHWDGAYRDRGTEGVSWFQPTATVSIELMQRLGIPTDAAILDVGGGATTLVDALVADGFRDLSVLDVSEVALGALRERLGPNVPVRFIHADFLRWTPDRFFDLWHDRAVLHFLVEDEARRKYLDALRRVLQVGGHLIVGTFAANGLEYCSGLPVTRYSAEALSELFGPDFEVVEHRQEEHITPAGAMQPFTWITARRQQ